MVDSQTSIFEMIAASMSSLGILVNAFITVTNVLDWLNQRKLKPYDKLMMCLSFSRVLVLFCFLFRITNRVCKLNAYNSDTARRVLRTVQLFFNFSSYWFTMWLCLLYYVKIAIFKNTLLLRFKLSIPQVITPMILVSSGICFGFGIFFAFNIKETSDIMDSMYLPVNESFSKDLKFILPTYYFGHFIPFIVEGVSNVLLIETISVHIQHMKKNIPSLTTPSLVAHISAIRSVCLLQFMSICNLIGTLVFYFDCCKSISKSITFLIINLHPTLHSVVLITGNAKLKRPFCKILNSVQDCCKMELSTSINHLESKTETVMKQN